MSRRHCLVCGIDLFRDYASDDEEAVAAAVNRQLACGVCDMCHRLRIAAARELMSAADTVRLLRQLGGEYTSQPGRRNPPRPNLFAQAIMRAADADARCTALKMWPAARPVAVRPRGVRS